MRVDVREHGAEAYRGLVVIDADTGFKIALVVAADDEEGWVLVGRMVERTEDQAVRELDPETGYSKLMKFHRPIRILRKSDMPREQRVGVINLGLAYD